nr:cytochrome c biogenesis protein CcsA [uncultured Carboxylicivirga sp.]
MKRLLQVITSHWLMGTLLLFLAAVLGIATFIENDFGTNASKALVYNSWWFELVFVLLAINMLGNLSKYKTWSIKKLPVLIFHLAFLCIIIGAGITRYIGYEGNMHIREGEESDVILSSDQYVKVNVSADKYSEEDEAHVLFSAVSPNEYSSSFSTPKGKLKLKSKMFIPQATSRAVEKDGGEPALQIVLSSNSGRQEYTLFEGDEINVGDYSLAFHKEEADDDIVLMLKDGIAYFQAKDTVGMMQMQTGEMQQFEPGKQHKLFNGVLYSYGDLRMVYTNFLESAVVEPVSIEGQNGSGLPDAIKFVAQLNGNEKEFFVFGQNDVLGRKYDINIDGINISVSYGAKKIHIPFSLALKRFELDRYPGSESPSSYASEVTLVDERTGLKEDRRIFMNNILNYKGYRFFQSSYDRDEKGTILSVNRDFWGTLFTYAGYAILALGMVLSLIFPNTRFRKLGRRIDEIYKEKKKYMAMGLLLIAIPAMSQELNPSIKISQETADAFGHLWVQDNGGRMKPVNSLNSEIVRKLVKHHTFKGLSADQVALGILVDPAYWQSIPLITVKHDELRSILQLREKKSSINNFFTPDGKYKIRQLVEASYRKRPAFRNKLEQEAVKVDEQVNVFFMHKMGSLYHLFPLPGNESNKWALSKDALHGVDKKDSLFIKSVFNLYLQAIVSGDKEKEHTYLDALDKYQHKYGADIISSDYKKDIEIFYNKSSIFMSLMPYFLGLGLILLIFQLIRLVQPKLQFKWILRVGLFLVVAAFVVYTIGLCIRWYISGHAPWSNGYESMLYIGWTTLVAGLSWARKNPIALSVSSIFAGIILMVAHLSWMNPEITNLVPVLKSYWLTIHVAIIVASYGFLGNGFLLGFLNLILIGAKNKQNEKTFSLTIEELTAISERAMTVGLYLLTVGAFLGGVWANESWGRYWGWDPKETWSAVTILVYAFILHMRFIPGMKSITTFNIWSVIGFSSVIMTYLGVNYYLAGMHSYAKGDPVPIPSWVYYSVVITAVVIFYAIYNEKQLIRGDDAEDEK